MEWLTAKLDVDAPNASAAVCHLALVGATDPMLADLLLYRASVSLEPTRGISGRCLSKYGTAPMWSSQPWVRTSATTSASRSMMASRPGRIRSMIIFREEHTAVDQQEPAAILQDGHVATDVTETAEGSLELRCRREAEEASNCWQPRAKGYPAIQNEALVSRARA